MKALIPLMAVALAIPIAAPVSAQGNDDDYTPLNSRIKRDRQFPTEPVTTFSPRELSAVQQRRSMNMEDQFAKCLWDRSNEKGRNFLARSDFGVTGFEEINIKPAKVPDLYPIHTCLGRVADSNASGVSMRFDAPSIRRWYIQAAYLDMYKDGPSWIRPGMAVSERDYPVTPANSPVRAAMALADCVVALDPYTSDVFFRSDPGGADESQAIDTLSPALGACVPDGNQVELSIPLLRRWIGEGLWQASQNNYMPASQDQSDSR